MIIQVVDKTIFLRKLDWVATARHNKKNVLEQMLDGNSVHVRSNTLGVDPLLVIDTNLFGRNGL